MQITRNKDRQNDMETGYSCLTRLLKLFFALALLSALVFSALPTVSAAQAKTDLSAVKTYLLEKTNTLKTGSQTLQKSVTAYYDLAKAANFDYAALWKQNANAITAALTEAKAAWRAISPNYEQIEGIVAGVPVLKIYDPILDSGVKDEVEFDLSLPDGRTLKKPGNLFGLLETSLWGTEKTFVRDSVDLDGDGKVAFGEALPDAVLVKGFADGMAKYTADLYTDAEKWTPTETDAFTALVVMVPTMKEYFNAWKVSRFVAGDQAASGEFSVISRLADITDIVGSLQVVYEGVSPLVTAKDPATATEIKQGLADLKQYAGGLLEQENKGKKFSPEQADLFATEAQANADALTGKISQMAALLGIRVENQ